MKLPLLETLGRANHVLIAGAGGGFDLFSGLPLYFALRATGVRVSLASYAFSYLGGSDADEVEPGLYRVDADTSGEDRYFPERFLSEWLRIEEGVEQPIYSFDRRGVLPLRLGYRALVESLGVDTVVLVDGGTDSLMRGDEAGLGTPAEDVASIVAVGELDVDSYLVCLGFGVDRFHGVCHAHFLEAVAALARQDAYLGAFSLLPDMPAVQRYVRATEYVQRRTPGRESIVCASVVSALEGEYGDHHRTTRTRGSELWINPLMSLLWCFRLPPVYERLLYADWIRDTTSHYELQLRIEAFRDEVERRPWREIPV